MASQPTVFLTLGLPGSGKTYFAGRLAAEREWFFLNCDLLRLAMIETPAFTPAEHTQVFKVADFIAEQHLRQGLNVIYGANFNRRLTRQKWQQRGRQERFGAVTLYIQTPPEVVAQRIQARNHDIPAEKQLLKPLELLEKMQKNLEPPAPGEPTIVIDGTLPFAQQLDQFARALRINPLSHLSPTR